MSHAPAAELVDSRPRTYEHVLLVQRRLMQVISGLQERLLVHDASKFEEPELSAYDELEARPRVPYGSEAYKQNLRDLGPALEHHYASNDHHPEHFAAGVGGMGLVQLMEMLADWKASSERTPDGDLLLSIVKNAERFGYGPEISGLLLNTAKELGWLDA